MCRTSRSWKSSFYPRCVTTCLYHLNNGRSGRVSHLDCSHTIAKECGKETSQGKCSSPVFLLLHLSLQPRHLRLSPSNHNTCPCRARRTGCSFHTLLSGCHLRIVFSPLMMILLYPHPPPFTLEFHGSDHERKTIFHRDCSLQPRDPNNRIIPDHWEFKCHFHSKEGCITLRNHGINLSQNIRHNRALKLEVS